MLANVLFFVSNFVASEAYEDIRGHTLADIASHYSFVASS